MEFAVFPRLESSDRKRYCALGLACQSAQMQWGWERVGAVAYVSAFPVLFSSACSWYRCCFSCLPCAKLRVGRCAFVVLSLLWSTLLGFLWALWLHWLPCGWLDCDLREGDEGELRGALLFASWPAFALLFAVGCQLGCDLGPVVRSTHVELAEV